MCPFQLVLWRPKQSIVQNGAADHEAYGLLHYYACVQILYSIIVIPCISWLYNTKHYRAQLCVCVCACTCECECVWERGRERRREWKCMCERKWMRCDLTALRTVKDILRTSWGHLCSTVLLVLSGSSVDYFPEIGQAVVWLLGNRITLNFVASQK